MNAMDINIVEAMLILIQLQAWTCAKSSHLKHSEEDDIWVQSSLESFLVFEVKEKQDRDPSLVKLKESVKDQKVKVFS